MKVIFIERLKKEERTNPLSQHYQKISSYKTMESYRNVWNNMFNYLREHWKLKNSELITHEHVVAYIDYKLEYYPSKKYLEKIVSAIGKLEVALMYYALENNTNNKYDFSIRLELLKKAKNLELVADNYHDRSFDDPELIINSLELPNHRLAAKIQYEGGARLEGVSLIKHEQLKGLKTDNITNKEVGVIETKEKGGKVGDVLVHTDTYIELLNYFKIKKIFKLDKNNYMKDIRLTTKDLNLTENASHSFRWSFAKRRMYEYANAGYAYEASLQAVSYEMKHNRASITEHYLCT